MIADEALEQYAGEYLARPTELDWKAGTLHCSQELVTAYQRVFSAFRSAPTPMQVQSTMVDLFAIMLREVIAGLQGPLGEGETVVAEADARRT